MYREQKVDNGEEAGLFNGELSRPAPYYAKTIENIDNGPGAWNSLRIGIYDREDKQIGEYNRNYSSLYRTFHPFQLRGNWYALYSKDYTATRIMSLPDCRDIGGEARDQWGFCPVDYYVPCLSDLLFHHIPGCPRDWENGNKPDGHRSCTCHAPHSPECPYTTDKKPCNSCAARKTYDALHWEWVFSERTMGFIAGCVWGDDSSWKIQFLDLSRADEGIVKREARFGYVEMADGQELKDAINYEGDSDYITLNVRQHFNIRTGRDINEPDEPKLPETPAPKFILL